MPSLVAMALPALLLGVQDPPAAGQIKGRVEFSGPAPKRQMIPVPKPDRNLVGAEEIADESIVVALDGGLKNVFVWAKGGLTKDVKIPAPKDAFLKIQKGRFFPRVVGIQAGGKLNLLNRNEPAHFFNVHGLSKLNKEFNLALAAGGSWSVAFELPEFMIRVRDDLHRWMTAYICVVDHPFFAVTDDKGEFQIKDLPPGDYELEAWHESFGNRTEKVTVKKDEGASVRFAFKAP